MKEWWEYDPDEYEPTDQDWEEYYQDAEQAEYQAPQQFTNTYWITSTTYTWDELEKAWKALNIQPGNVAKNLEATPDDWLDTGLWIKNLKEKTYGN